ncbi:CorA family divalent cation transporter [Myxococcota bacterium]|nr:CorA family divalent cation transporter [Myxococcota bacterium]
MEPTREVIVEEVREIIFWPLQLVSSTPGAAADHPWRHLEAIDGPWKRVSDVFTRESDEFQERHYIEFITFLPYVQRLLHGEGGDGKTRAPTPSPIHLFRRSDVKAVRVTFPDGERVVLDVPSVDLFFFYDLDLVIVALELRGTKLTLSRTQELLFRFGRAYPHFWNGKGDALHCVKLVEWLGPTGNVLSTSDYEERSRFLEYVHQQRAPRISQHWTWLLEPLVPHHAGTPGELRFRQLEYHRMPIMTYLAVDDMSRLTRADFVRLGFVAAPGSPDSLPYASGYLEDFEKKFCYDRFHEDRAGAAWSDTRIICCGHAFVMVGNAGHEFFRDPQVGLLSQFRHQYFVLGMIAHLHKASLLMLRDRLGQAVNRLDLSDIESIRGFKRSVRHTLEVFLRFSHRYWFQEVAVQVQARDIFHLWRRHLGTEALFSEVREEVHDMSSYLSSEDFRHQADTVLRLTVVTIFGLIGTLATGVLGMNLFDETQDPPTSKIVIFLAVAVPTALAIFYTIVKSKRLSDFLDALSNDRLGTDEKLAALKRVWRSAPPKVEDPETARGPVF